MSYSKSILVCGGDKRQKYMYRYMKDNGLNVNSFGLYKDDINEIDDVKKYDVVIFPVPMTKDGIYLNSGFEIKIDDILNMTDKGQIILGGMCDREGIIDYFKEDVLQVYNALPTAEGALQVAMENTDITLNQSNCAVFGYGRIGKILSSLLKKLGAKVTVYARNPKDIAFATAFGYEALNINYPEKTEKFDVIFNTVPMQILDSGILNKTKEDVLLIELASKPYGIDIDAAEKLNRKVVIASGLPGKVAPKTAGKILCDVIMDMLIKMENDKTC